MSYDVKTIKAPRLTGPFLKAFTYILENRISRQFVLAKLFKDAGIHDFRNLQIQEQPTFYPIQHNQGKQTVSHPQQQQTYESKKRPWVDVNTIAKAYRAKEITPIEIAEHVIQRIRQHNPKLSIFIRWNEEDILAQAKASANRFLNGQPIGLLDGIPIAVKDEIDQEGYPTTVGTSFLGNQSAKQDGTSVARLRKSGAILIGKANMHEIGIGVTGYNSHYGTPENPYGLKHYPGGSSSGSAAAVAAGFCPIAVAADGGGSIRIPSAFCGTVGLKPTFGRVSEHGAAPLCWSVAHIGPIGTCAQDVALAYMTMAGPDPEDPLSQYQPDLIIPQLDNMDLTGIRIGIFSEWFHDADQNIVVACENMIKHFENCGAQIIPIDIPNLEAIRVAHMITIASEIITAMSPHYLDNLMEFGYDVRINLAIALELTNKDYVKAQQVRTLAMKQLNNLFNTIDVIATPATACTAPPIKKDALSIGESDLETLSKVMRFAPLANLTGNPAIVFPVGYNSKGLPIGMQLIGNHWQEHLLLEIARVSEYFITIQKPNTCYPIL
ncbi:MAG: amidase [Desulfobacterales bacterium]|nr:amidase [Desulfobacterales bacterium]